VSLRHHEIAETNHRILDPFTDEKLRLLGEVAGVTEGTRALDLACGKGEMLCRWAEWFGSSGVGVDLGPALPRLGSLRHPSALTRFRGGGDHGRRRDPAIVLPCAT
jgi:hypothetical protein